MDNEKRINALAEFLEIPADEIDEIEASEYQDNGFEYGNQEYLVLTDDEADTAARDDIENSLWAFNTSFLMMFITDDDWSSYDYDATEKALQELQAKLCESANPIMLKLVGDNFDALVKDAILSDGRGHFLGRYDSEENESDDCQFYIYRIN